MSIRPPARLRVAIAGVVVLAATAARWVQRKRRSRASAIPPSVPAPPAVGRLGPTLEMYRELHEGQNPEAVARLIGEEGRVLNRNHAHGIVTVTREWRTEDGQGRLYVVFQKSRLVAKSQDGLR